MMQKSCPISSKKVDEKQIRTNSTLVFLLCVASLVFDAKWIVWILAFDFAIKSTNITFSPISIIIKKSFCMFRFAKKEIDYAPKKFAAGVATIMLFGAILLERMGANGAYSIVVSAVAFCALLEGLFAYCVGCKVYEISTSLRQ